MSHWNTLSSIRLPGFDDACVLHAVPLAAPVADQPVVFRSESAGFVVEEIPSYLPSGAGEHLYLHIEKRDLSSVALLRRIAERFGLDEREVGYAGRKDERGITRQWVSVPARKVEPELHAVESLGVRLLASGRHNNKLRLGHLRGNRFTITLDAGSMNVDALRARAQQVATGIPNLFGEQRFGVGGSTLEQAMRFLERGRPARGKRDEFLVSAVQSSLFNAWLAARVDVGTWRTPLDGDVLEKTENGAPFVCVDPAADAVRAARGDVVVAGPLLGRSMRSAERDALTFESQCWDRLEIPRGGLVDHPAFGTGARRPACVVPTGLDITATGDSVTVQFSLGKGAYASVVMRALFGAAFHDAAFDQATAVGDSAASAAPPVSAITNAGS